MIIAKTHDDMYKPPKMLMTTETVQKSQLQKKSLTDAFISAATAIAKASQASVAGSKNEKFGAATLQKLYKDGILSQEEFDAQMKIVLSLNHLS